MQTVLQTITAFTEILAVEGTVMSVLRGLSTVMRAIGVTILIAPLGTALLYLPLVIRLEIGQYLFALVIISGVYFIFLCLLGWPTVAVLRALGLRHRNAFMAAGAVEAVLMSFIVSGGFTPQPAEQLLWLASGALSGAVAGALLGRFDGARMFHVQQLEDERAGYTRQTTYRAFFSYSRADDAVADWLWGYLDKYRVPAGLMISPQAADFCSESLHPIFRDRFDLSAGGSLSTRLQSALERSDNLIVLCTPHSANSSWVDHEVRTFLSTGKETKIFPIIAAGEPDSADPASECLPAALRGRGLLAADLREGAHQGRRVGDGREFGALKIIAGMLGVDFDQLIGREHRRQLNRSAILLALFALTSALAAAALLFAYIAVGAFAWNQNNLEEAFASELDYLTLLYRADGSDGVRRYLDTRTSLNAGRASRLLCPYLLDADGVPFGQHGLELRLPVPAAIGTREKFSREILGKMTYAGSPFYRRLDGLVERVSQSHAVAVSFCNYDPPLFYGVFRAYFAGKS
jgi:hypothetical protein